MFTKEAINFLEDLKANNTTEWMHANKKRYEAYKKDYHNLISNILEEIKPLDPSLEPLEVKNCTFRINRDIRFSKDKSPYKTNMGIWMSTNKLRKNSPGYYIHFEKGKCFIAGGVWCPETDDLKKIRREIAFFYEDLEEIVNDKTFKKEFNSLDREEGNVLKSAPKGYDNNHPAIEFLKLKSFTISQPIDEKWFTDQDFAKKIASKLITIKPFNSFLNRALETEE
ncbi:DUF2461 domain-containing protein [Flavobacterium oreochromis]|uniref:TIGR02453 family protein n=2 Tax=Flavobacterium TaxID=237 RepID=A0A246GC64_9FLAO|nr:DUF2461 domain-containing protein [Flavobacterium oreochromis]OWP77894.1 TIGR02453 family protein [Flavobacterium oreochromis]OWP78612.1 TIGR02453 family protein [Flavobacterium oreochromis]POR30615.1 TIGR02453 family protein [Flavobacterium columnare]QYS85617.1 DUF2461 domain-containing protein [Flavobacterium oreochromis]